MSNDDRFDRVIPISSNPCIGCGEPPIPPSPTWQVVRPTKEELERLQEAHEESLRRHLENQHRQAQVEREILVEDVALMKKLGVVAWKGIALSNTTLNIHHTNDD